MKDVEQAVALHGQARDDLQFHKGQQWKTTNYVLISLAVLVSVSELFGSPDKTFLLWVWSIGLFASILAALILRDQESSVKRSRARMIRFRSHMSVAVRRDWDTCASTTKGERRRRSLLPTFIAAIVLGFVLFSAILYFRVLDNSPQSKEPTGVFDSSFFGRR